MAAGQGDVIHDIFVHLAPDELATVGAAIDVLHAGLQRATGAATYDTISTPQGTTA